MSRGDFSDGLDADTTASLRIKLREVCLLVVLRFAVWVGGVACQLFASGVVGFDALWRLWCCCSL